MVLHWLRALTCVCVSSCGYLLLPHLGPGASGASVSYDGGLPLPPPLSLQHQLQSPCQYYCVCVWVGVRGGELVIRRSNVSTMLFFRYFFIPCDWSWLHYISLQ